MSVMPANLSTFTNETFGNIRTMNIDGKPWFIGKDIAEALGYSKARSALRLHVDEEDKSSFVTSSPGGDQQMIAINESGMYSLILSSKLPKAKQFKRWITSDVLPKIRETGSFAALPDFSNPVIAARAWADELENRQKAEQQALILAEAKRKADAVIEEQKPKADYYDAITKTDENLTSIRETCKQIGVPEKKTISMLLIRGYLFRGKNDSLVPYAEHTENGDGMFKVVEIVRNEYKDKNGITHKIMCSQTKFTVEGKQRLISLCKRWGLLNK